MFARLKSLMHLRLWMCRPSRLTLLARRMMVNDVDILVHFGWVVVLNLVLEVVQEQHLWLV